MSVLLYGANGYTGALTAKLAVDRGIKPILSGRNPEKVGRLAKELGLPYRPFALGDAAAAAKALDGVKVVVHCAGPFAHTFKAMSEHCVAAKAHYLDITGEVTVFEAMAARTEKFKQAGIMAMPGVGFDVVPSDCLAAHLKRRLPSATKLVLGFQGLGRISHGTAKTMVENFHRGSLVRKDGKLTPIPAGSKTREIDFGRGPVLATAIPWGDLSTAFHSTGIGDIEVYSVFPKAMVSMMRSSSKFGWLLGSAPVQALLKWRISKQPAGPSDEERRRGLSLLWGEATDPSGAKVASRIRGPEGYTLTALTTLAVVEKVLAGQAPIGFQTPSQAYGPDLILEIPGAEREDLP